MAASVVPCVNAKMKSLTSKCTAHRISADPLHLMKVFFLKLEAPIKAATLTSSPAACFTSAVPTGFEPAISSLTGTYARPLHHGTH